MAKTFFNHLATERGMMARADSAGTHPAASVNASVIQVLADYGLPDLESFLRAALLLLTSITAGFNFPQWHHCGGGSGENSTQHRYSLQVLA